MACNNGLSGRVFGTGMCPPPQVASEGKVTLFDRVTVRNPSDLKMDPCLRRGDELEESLSLVCSALKSVYSEDYCSGAARDCEPTRMEFGQRAWIQSGTRGSCRTIAR
jgi:hypothetical protein